MKKLLQVLLSFCMLLTFSACGGAQDKKTDYDSIKIETIDDFSLETVASNSVEKRFICELDTGEWEGTVNDYDLYYYGLDKVNIIVGDKIVSLKDALDNGVLNAQFLLDRFEADKNAKKCKSDSMQDGGTTYYAYPNHTIIKYNRLGGTKDLYIGVPDMKSTVDKEKEVDGKKDYSGIKAENTNDFEVSVVKAETAEKKYIMHIREYDQSIDGDRPQLFYYGLDAVNISINGITLPLVEAIKNDVINTKLLLDKFEADATAGKCKSDMYKDGGTLYYEYSDFKVLKFNILDGVNDLYIGTPDMPYEIKDK